MSITDELRTGGIYRFPSNRRVFTEEELTAIADRIDAEHESAMRYERCAFWHDASDDELAKYGLLRAPIDADGVPIRVGDVMEWCDSGDTLTVEGIGKDIVFYIENEGAEWTAARNKRHHEPTVEDVLREFAEKVIDSQIPNVHPTYEEAIAEYAAKLRLADDGKEQ